jgi:hypothetical protein
VHRGFYVGNAAELDTQRGAAAAGLWMQGGVEVLNGFSRFGEGGVELRVLGERGHFFQFAFAQRARDVAAYQLPQGFEFEDFSACLQDRRSQEKKTVSRKDAEAQRRTR